MKLVTSGGRGKVNESLEENEFLILAISVRVMGDHRIRGGGKGELMGGI